MRGSRAAALITEDIMSETIETKTTASQADDSGFRPDLQGLADVIEDARRAALDSDPGPAEPSDYVPLLAHVEAANEAFPPLYQQEFVGPYGATLRALGAQRFTQILAQDPNRESTG